MSHNIPPALVAAFDQSYAQAVADLDKLVAVIAARIEAEGLVVATSLNAALIERLPEDRARGWASIALSVLAQRKLADEGRTVGGGQ